ncbi:MAG: polysaccharide deacetylase family protein [Minicystis sp.]
MKRAPGLRARAGDALDRAGLLDRALWLRARLGRRELAVLTYHRVGRPEAAGDLDPAVFEVEPDELAAQLAVLRAHCTVVSLADVRRFARGRRLPPNPVLVTFDDGYADAHDVALPILRRAGVPATFFIPTAFPDAGRLFWWDRVWLTMRRCSLARVEIDYPRPLSLRPAADPEGSARLVCRAIKRTPGIDLARLFDALEARSGVSIAADDEQRIARRIIMGWPKVRALRDAGMDVQSHAHEHLVLNTLTPEQARRDLARSAEVLREMVGGDIFAVAYPVGYTLEGALRRAPEQACFELGFTNGTGICAADRFDPLNVPRLSMDLEIAGAEYKLCLLLGSPPGLRAAPEASLA